MNKKNENKAQGGEGGRGKGGGGRGSERREPQGQIGEDHMTTATLTTYDVINHMQNYVWSLTHPLGNCTLITKESYEKEREGERKKDWFAGGQAGGLLLPPSCLSG